MLNNDKTNNNNNANDNGNDNANDNDNDILIMTMVMVMLMLMLMIIIMIMIMKMIMNDNGNYNDNDNNSTSSSKSNSNSITITITIIIIIIIVINAARRGCENIEGVGERFGGTGWYAQRGPRQIWSTNYETCFHLWISYILISHGVFELQNYRLCLHICCQTYLDTKVLQLW